MPFHKKTFKKVKKTVKKIVKKVNPFGKVRDAIRGKSTRSKRRK